MFIDLKNGKCINASEVLGAAFGKRGETYLVNITMRPFNPQNQINIKEAPKPASIEIKFNDINQANSYINKYFNIENYFN
ncbi:hypothetical protein IC789_05345 [Acinetobacter seifertii]|uniref:Uncharacterized protein n=2 Tax=Acinetobacter TaxID=469 RepID=A0A7H2SX81_9GAMM|nr:MULTISPECIES: hypothetical protein [Acinetobacter]ONN51825.1 hypothetical protein AC058_18390 [Acinetobacter genomosp. 33YU]QNX11345.1 hypothetical protein IC794_14660 [Acinetobacter seifertii]QNX20752.1 hypothetical protein IC792_05355 [Acinetobacter seifertii]QNX27327.1 hypothetical protein IC791_05220 [Acinetobacter seifertii]QNX38369.1 hypothetical protein IC789_05345 [Acinetobacter seifertii]